MKTLYKRLISFGLVALLSTGLTLFTSTRLCNKRVNKVVNQYELTLAQADSITTAYEAKFDSNTVVITALKHERDSFKTIVEHLSLTNNTLYNSLDSAVNSVKQAPYDENYNYLQEERYPTEDTLKYPFSGSQVKDITIDVVAGDYKDSIIDNQDNIISSQRAELLSSDIMINTLYRERGEFKSTVDKLNKQIILELAAKHELEAHITAMKKQHRTERFMMITGLVGLGVLILL